MICNVATLSRQASSSEDKWIAFRNATVYMYRVSGKNSLSYDGISPDTIVHNMRIVLFIIGINEQVKSRDR